MFDEFKDPNFNADEWINNIIDYKDGEDVQHYEDAVNKLLISLQMNGRDISQTTDQNIRGLVEALPQAMAKLKHISESVNELSGSLRSLTNSGYKFKSDNVTPDKIGELSNLKVRRDRLKEASDKLQHGIEIESDLQQLQPTASIGDLKTVCEKYRNVSNASESLSTISKFDSIKNNLTAIQKILENRIIPELNSACLRMNSETFSKYLLYSQQIGSKNLPLESIYKTFRQQVEKERNTYDCDPPLPITDWLSTLLKRSHEILVNYTKWTVSLTETKPGPKTSQPDKVLSVNSKIITDELSRIFEDVISPSIDKHVKQLFEATKYDDLSTVFGIVDDFSSSTIRGNSQFFRKTMNYIQSQFSDSFKSYLNAHLPKGGENRQPLPKSNTSSNLSRQFSLPTSSRSTESFQAANPSEKPDEKKDCYDPKMLENSIAVASKSLEWIQVLARDPPKCVDAVCAFMCQVIQRFTFDIQYHLELESSKLNSGPSIPRPAQGLTSDDSNRQTMFISNLIVVFMAQVSLEKKLKSFENSARQLKSDLFAPSIQPVKDVIEEKILSVMSMKSLQLLKNLHAANEWSAQSNGGDQISSEFDIPISTVILDQSVYVKEISNSIMQTLQTLTQGSALSSDLIRKWTTKTADTIVTAYAKEIAEIPRLSKSGAEQLKTDIDYLLNLLNAMDLEGGKELPGILAVLSAEPSQRKDVLDKSDLSPEIAKGIKNSLSIP